MEQVFQRNFGCPILGGIWEQAGWSSEQPYLTKGVPALAEGLDLGTLRSLATQNILWFYDIQQKGFQCQVCSHCGVPNPKMCWEGLRGVFPSSQSCWVVLGCICTCFCFAFDFFNVLHYCAIWPPQVRWASFSTASAVLNCLGWWQIFSADMSQRTLLSMEMYLQNVLAGWAQ